MKTKIVYALASVCIAFGLWLYVITAVSPESTATYHDVPVVMEGETVLNENGLMITGQNDMNIDLSLSGNRTDLSKVNSGNIGVKVDLSRIHEPGQAELQYNILFPGNVASNAFVIESKYPESIVVNVEERRVKEVPVEVHWEGTTPEGFLCDKENKVLNHPTIKVVGPASVADQIVKAVIEVDLQDRKESISESYRYTLCDKNNNPVDAKLITTNVEEVRLNLRIDRFKNIRLTYNLVEGGGANEDNTVIDMSVDSIRVSGSEAALENMGDQLVIGTINLRDITKDGVLTYPVNLPEGVRNLSGVTEVQIVIRFAGLGTKEFAIENINGINIPEGMDAEVIAEKINVVVRGPLTSLNGLKAEDLAIEVDFTGAEVGTSTYKGTVVFPEGYENFGTLGSLSASATVKKK